MSLPRLLCTLLLSLALSPPAMAGEARFVLKFATLAPAGSTWAKRLGQWGEELDKASDGRLTLKLYPGGVQGDEPDVLRKMRFGQLQGGAFTGYGIGRIYSPARVLEMPFLFDNAGEVDTLRAELSPEFEAGFRKAGYELLGWMAVGKVHFFSKFPIRSLDDLRERKIWLWQGDPLGEAWFKAADIAPVPLSITDVFTSLSTGLIDTVYCTPLAALALQWFNKVDYMTNVPMAEGIGALVVNRSFFDRLPKDLRRLLRDSGRRTGAELIRATRAENAESRQVLRDSGIEFVLDPGDLDQAEVDRLRRKAESDLIGQGYIPRPLFERVVARLAELRRGPGTATEGDASP